MANILNYIKTVWRAGREGGTAWTPERLNNIENGIEQATNQINQNSQDIETINSNLINRIYPIGSIYMSVNNTNPSSFFGGTWVAWGSGRVPVGVDTSDSSFNSVEKQAGSKTVSITTSGTVGNTTLTINQIPSHNHIETLGSSIGVTGGGNYGISPQVYGEYTSTSKTTAYQQITLNTGGGQPHSHSFSGSGHTFSILQPYITCYMWKRTA